MKYYEKRKRERDTTLEEQKVSTDKKKIQQK
jgi:hypothetical protein